VFLWEKSKGEYDIMRIVAIDQSYTCFGVSVVEGDKVLLCESYGMPFKTKTQKRRFYSSVVQAIALKYKPSKLIVERVRVFSKGFMSIKAILALGTLVAVTVDSVEVPVYSVDTRSWKAKVLGSAKATKEDAVRYVKDNYGFDVDHNAADSAGIGLSVARGCNLELEE
jgi:Holliday junction resolvasome RuvABC endonuclease subunit